MDDKNSATMPERFLPQHKDPYKYMANTDHDLSQFHKIGQLSERSRKIQLSYNELVESTIQCLQDTKTSPKDVIKRLDAYIPDECRQATDLDDFFFCLIPHMSFFNYDLLKMIIELTGNNDLQGKLSNYENQFESYCRNRISGPHPVVFTSEALNKEQLAEKLLIKLDAEWEGIPLADIKRFHCKVASILQVRQESLLIQKVQKGCVLFTFLIREAVALRILENGLTRSQETALQEERVMSVVIGTETLFKTDLHQTHQLRAVVTGQENRPAIIDIVHHTQMLASLWNMYIVWRLLSKTVILFKS